MSDLRGGGGGVVVGEKCISFFSQFFLKMFLGS